MSDMNKNIEINSNDAPPVTPRPLNENNDILYCCSECSSLIEILSINDEENIIEFKCLNKNGHDIKRIPISEYFERMNKYKKKCFNDDLCIEHSSNKNNKYESFCFECNRHLCKECLKTRDHISHNKNNILEIKPIKEELNLIEEIIKYYKVKIENMKNEKINKIRSLENRLDINIKKQEKKIKEKIEINIKL